MNATRRIFLFALPLAFGWLCGGAVTAVAAGDAVPASRWPSRLEEGAYHVRRTDTAQVLWDVIWRSEVREEAGRKLVEIHEHGYGQPWEYRQPISWEKQLVLQVEPALHMRGMEGKRWGVAGNLVSELEVKVRSERGSVFYRDTGKEESADGKELAWTPDLFADEFLFHWARTLSFDREPAGEMTLLISPERQFRVRASVRGKEVVETPAGTFFCHRVDLVHLKPLVRFVAPRMTLWCTVAPPHFWVRYEGPIGGPGSPRVVIELVRFRQEEG